MPMLVKVLPSAGLLIGFGVLAAATGLASPSPAWSTVQSQANPGATRSRRVCRDLTPTGTRLMRRVCRSQADWDEEARKSSESVRRQQADSVRQEPIPNPF